MDELNSIGLAHRYDDFVQENVDDETLKSLTEDDLKHFAYFSAGDKIKLRNHVLGNKRDPISVKVRHNRELGSGHSGTVYEGYIHATLRVALKQPNYSSNMEREESILKNTR